MLLAVLASCDKNSNYPKEYVGFEKRSIEYAFSPEKNTEEFDVKIIAADKQHRQQEGRHPRQEEVGQGTRQNLSRTHRQTDHPASGVHPQGQEGAEHAAARQAEAERQEVNRGNVSSCPGRATYFSVGE